MTVVLNAQNIKYKKMGINIVAHALALVATGGISPVQVDLLHVGQQVHPFFEGLSTPWADLILNLHAAECIRSPSTNETS